MSSRERWTVYPLLVLTLGIALTDKVTRQIDTDRIVCRKLVVADRPVGQQKVDILGGRYGALTGLMFFDSAGRWWRPSLAIMSAASDRKRAEGSRKSPDKSKAEPAEKGSPDAKPGTAE